MSLFFKPKLPPVVLVLHFYCVSLILVLLFVSNSHPWRFWNEVYSWGAFLVALCMGALPVSLCRCLSPGYLRFSALLLVSRELCPSYTNCTWEQDSSSNTSRCLLANKGDSVGLYGLFHRSPSPEAGKYFVNQQWFLILTNFMSLEIFQPLLNFAFMVSYTHSLSMGLVS